MVARATRFIALLFALAAYGAAHDHHGRQGVLSLDVFPDGARLHLVTGEARHGKHEPVLLHARSDDGGATWSTPVRVDEGMPAAFSLHRGSDAQIAATGDHVIAAWTTAGTDKWGSGPIATAISDDGGKTWRAGPNPADDGATTGHGFIDIAADGSGTFHLTWLDSRDGRQGLRYARSADGGKTWSPNSTVKPATCECCMNALATDANGDVAILFRDSNPRDMGVAVSHDGGSRWLAPVRAGDFGWQFNGCPHVGGGIAFGQMALHATVWTGMSDRAGVYHLASRDRGATWSAPRRLGGATASHPAIAVAGDQRLAVVWDEQENGRVSIWGALSSDGGRSWTDPVQLSEADARATHPRVLATTEGFRVFWTEDRAEHSGGVDQQDIAVRA